MIESTIRRTRPGILLALTALAGVIAVGYAGQRFASRAAGKPRAAETVFAHDGLRDAPRSTISSAAPSSSLTLPLPAGEEFAKSGRAELPLSRERVAAIRAGWLSRRAPRESSGASGALESLGEPASASGDGAGSGVSLGRAAASMPSSSGGNSGWLAGFSNDAAVRSEPRSPGAESAGASRASRVVAGPGRLSSRKPGAIVRGGASGVASAPSAAPAVPGSAAGAGGFSSGQTPSAALGAGVAAPSAGAAPGDSTSSGKPQ
ncbi:MAG: hypothetical protein HY925_11040, partial [Elusimicrobia bacterium]|nr:hypothetical protein [Elusimicrobiota bacterium]